MISMKEFIYNFVTHLTNQFLILIDVYEWTTWLQCFKLIIKLSKTPKFQLLFFFKMESAKLVYKQALAYSPKFLTDITETAYR